jgi:hypothetical protein
MGTKGASSKDDPLHLNAADREIHIETLKAQIQNAAGQDIIIGNIQGGDPTVQEAFLEHVLAFESGEWVRPFDELISAGIDMLPAHRLGDTALTAKLWEVIRALAERRLFLENTDHLSDRELYLWLRDDALQQEFKLLGPEMGDWHLDALGGCSEEDLTLSMRFYASDEERKWWAAQFPGFPMPPRDRPPYDRDRSLPQPDPPPPECNGQETGQE